MKEHPILFSGLMVEAILRRRKTMTRRVVKPQPPEGWMPYRCGGYKIVNGELDPDKNVGWGPRNWDGDYAICSPYQVGDRLWVREAWWECVDNNDRLWYAADGPPPIDDRHHYRKRPSIFLPRQHSRITLEITAVRVERINSISEVDARAEIELWDSINGKKYPWISNPWVWVIAFKIIEVNK